MMRELHDQAYYQAGHNGSGQADPPVKKSSGSNGASTVLGRFLKLGKSKSDVHGTNANLIKRRAPTSSPGDEVEDDFCLSPVQLRGVERMVHKALRKDVSRSHSWIYGSVKLPSDLPFGYGYGGGSNNGSGNGSSAYMQPSPQQRQQLAVGNDYGNGMQLIPRCQMMDFCACDCVQEDFSFLNSNGGPSSSALLALSGNGPGPQSTNAPCLACQGLLVGAGGMVKYSKNGSRKSEDSIKKAFGSSVRKLTWKSLKQAVKKRPSLEALKKPPEVAGPCTDLPHYAQDDFLRPSTSYFFPEKKGNGFYASCTDLYGAESPHVTASVRVRPKRSRQTWHFPNEFGPTPNYQQEGGEEIYHSEWDLRQCMPYEEWITTSTSSLNPTVNPLTSDAFESVTSSVKAKHSSPAANSKGSQPDLYSNGGVKRFSILHTDLTAYQLNKSALGSNDEESESEDEDEQGGNVLAEDPVRIAGQGIVMPSPGTSRLARSNSSASNKFNNSGPTIQSKAKGNHPHHLLLGSTSTMEADGVWSDTQTQTQPKHASFTSIGSREASGSQKADKAKIDSEPGTKNLNTFKQPANGHYVKATNGSTTRLILNDHDPVPMPKPNKIESTKIEVSRKPTSTSVLVNGKAGKSSEPGSGGKYGALRRKRGGRSGPGKNLLRETIYEEESEGLESDEVYAVKIVVSQTGVTDYVKPILKTRTPVPDGEDGLLYDDVSGASENPKPVRSPKKVQFNATEEVVVCGGCSEPEYSEEDDQNDEEEDEETPASNASKHSSNVDDEIDKDPSPDMTMTPYVGQNQKEALISEEEEPVSVPIKNPAQEVPAQLSTSRMGEKSGPSNEVNNLPPGANDSKRQQLNQTLRQLAAEDSMRKNLRPSVPAPGPAQGKRGPEAEKSGTSRAPRSAPKAEPTPNVNPNRPSGSVKGVEPQKILNPNSLLFNDTTRIRLNQARPSLENTFQLNLSNGNGGGSKGRSSASRRIRPSHSFRSSPPSAQSPGLAGPRPKEPPPPPPRISSAPPRPLPPKPKLPPAHTRPAPPNKSQISLPMPQLGFSTTNDSVKEPTVPPTSHYHNSNVLAEKAEALSQQSRSHNGNSRGPPLLLPRNPVRPSPLPKPVISGPKPGTQNIEIVTRENSVSEIRIYSGTKILNIQAEPPEPLKPKAGSEMHYAASDLFKSSSHSPQNGHSSSQSSRPQSTSVVLIMNNEQSSSISEPLHKMRLSEPPQLPPLNSPAPRKEDTSLGQSQELEEPLYDDVINHSASKKQALVEKESPSKAPDFPPPTSPPPVPPPNKRLIGDDTESLQSVYSDVGGDGMTVSINDSTNRDNELLYDDTLAIRPTGPILRPKEGSMSIEEEEPLYDDVLNLIHTTLRGTVETAGPVPVDRDSDSGTETDVPPPLPASGPPALPKISMDLPLIPLPALPGLSKVKASSGGNSISKGTSRILGEIMGLGKRLSGSRETIVTTEVYSDVSALSPIGEVKEGNSASAMQFVLDLPEPSGEGEDEVLDRTRSLLNELNEKLSKLSLSPQDYSSYMSKVNLPASSSESSGVEEDYNSEKTYSGSSTTSIESDNYKLSKLVTETISMARGKFLDSMKIHGKSQLPPPDESDEPIYEEINESEERTLTGASSLILRSTSPVYADTFDAKSIFDGASRNEILSFLESIRDRLTAAETNPGDLRQPPASSGKKSRKFAEVERNDSGIGSEAGSLVAVTNGKSSLRLLSLCQDCNDAPADPRLTPGQDEPNPEACSPLCRSCTRKRTERREIIHEVYETELKYGRDLRIILDEFYNPIQIAGLLTKEQLDSIFLNVSQLIEINVQLTILLKRAIGAAGGEDENLNSVNVGRIFLEIGERMMSVFESYCTRQASAGAMLTQLEKEKELLRIFLRVSQMENTVLRRMNLPAFLMVPVQRVTRYPLLLSRLLKVTVPEHSSRDELQLAQEKIEQHLEHMNKTTREVASVKLWRRISIINGGGNNSSPSAAAPTGRRSSSDLDNGASVRIRKMALDLLNWANFDDVTCVIESQLHIVQLNGKSLKNIYACLLARGKDLESLALKMDQDVFFPPKTEEGSVKEVKLVLVRVKNGRFSFLREPLCLAKSVVSSGDGEFQDFIEINEITTKNTYYLQGMDKPGTSVWLRLLQCHAVCVGQWRRRRGALANIMMNGMIRHL